MGRNETVSGARERIAKILADTNDMTIATVREDGFPQATTVSYASDGLTIYFGSDPKSQKAQNIARCNKVSLTVNRPYGSWDEIAGLSASGIAARVTDNDEIQRAGKLMFAKFPEAAKYVQSVPGEIALFRVTLTVVSILDYAKGFGHTELVTF